MNTNYCHIFYTDDDTDDRELFQDAVNDVCSTLQLATQTSGDELVSLLKNPPPQPCLVFLDLNMPVKTGYEVLQEIREDNLSQVPIIIFSTSNDQQAIVKTRQLGARFFITKPNSYQTLKKVIEHTLSIDWKTFTVSEENFVYKA